MPKYLVPVTRECTETTLVDVDAATPEEAIAKAVEEARDEHWNFNWTHDDNSGDQNDPAFVGDIGEIEEA